MRFHNRIFVSGSFALNTPTSLPLVSPVNKKRSAVFTIRMGKRLRMLRLKAAWLLSVSHLGVVALFFDTFCKLFCMVRKYFLGGPNLSVHTLTTWCTDLHEAPDVQYARRDKAFNEEVVLSRIGRRGICPVLLPEQCLCALSGHVGQTRNLFRVV